MTAVQKRTFTRWMNHFLSERLLKVDDLFTDLKDGTMLVNLLELISSKSLGKYTERKKIKFLQHEIGNLELCLKFIKDEQLRLENIGANDIHEGNGKLILGLIWTLILRYQINLGGDGSSPKQDLLDWVNRQTAPYRDHIPEAQNFTKSWQDGKILAALAESLKNGIIDTKKAGQDPLRDLDNAMMLSEKHFEIPRLVDPEDMANNPDEHSNMTYISYFRDWLENKAKLAEQAKQRGPHAPNCFAVGRGVSDKGGFCGQPMPFTIHARNIQNQPVIGKWDRPMVVTITDGAGQNVDFELKDNKDGTFFCKYNAPTAVGVTQVRIQTDNYPGEPLNDIKGSVYQVPIREPSDPTKSYAEGPGLVRVFDDAPGLFTVYCRDKNNQPVVGEKLTVTVEQVQVAPGGRKVDNVPLEVKDNEDGTHSVKYDALVPGVYRVNVEVPAGPIRDMPKDVQCMKSADASKTIAEGPGVTQGMPRVGLDAPFDIIVKDSDGKKVDSGGHDLVATVHGPTGPVECPLVDNKDGTYKCNYKPVAPGDHVVDIKLNGENIKDAPFRLNIIKPADPSKSYAEGPGLIQAWDNKKNPFKVFAKDEDGKPVPGEPVEVTVTPVGGGPAAPVEVKDNGDGTYDVGYMADKPGEYDINVKIRGEPIKDMPKRVMCYEGIDPTKSTVEGPGVEGGFAGRELPFTVYTRDKHGKPVPVGNGNLSAKVTGPKGDVPCELKDNGDGTYSGLYKPDTPGTYKVMVALEDGKPVGKSPYSVQVRKGADPDKSFAVGAGWKEAWDCLPTKFTIHAKDSDGKAVPGEVITVVMSEVSTPAEKKKLQDELDSMDDYLKQKKQGEVENVEKERKEKQAAAEQEAKQKGTEVRQWTDPRGDVLVTVRDNGDGSYLAEYCAANAGQYNIAVTIGGDVVHIRDSPKKVPVHLSKPRVVFWSHTYDKQQEELKKLKQALLEAEQRLKEAGLV
eukprot:g10107.t1